MKICVIGFGNLGGAILKLLQDFRYDVTCISKDMPKLSGQYSESDFDLPSNNDLALGNLNTADVQWSNELFAPSYAKWMKKVGDPMHAATLRGTRISQYWPEFNEDPKLNGDPEWASVVQGYRRDNEEFISYDSFAFAPVMLGCVRFERAFYDGLGKFEKRKLTENEIALLRSGKSLPGFDLTIVAMGLSLKKIWPEIKIDAVKELMVNMPRDWKEGSYVDEKNKLFVASQPNRLVVNGFLGGEEQLTEEEKLQAGVALIEKVNKRFSLSLDPASIQSVVVNDRASVQGRPIIDFSRGEVVVVGGSERKGSKLSVPIAEEVFKGVCEKLGEPARPYDRKVAS